MQTSRGEECGFIEAPHALAAVEGTVEPEYVLLAWMDTGQARMHGGALGVHWELARCQELGALPVGSFLATKLPLPSACFRGEGAGSEGHGKPASPVFSNSFGLKDPIRADAISGGSMS